MKKNRIIYSFLLLTLALGMGSCREKEFIADDIKIPGLGGTEEASNELDQWLYENFTKPYNIEVVYRWDAAQMYTSLSSKLVPVEYADVKPMLAAVRDVWFEPYIQVAGPDFLKRVAPKKVVLVGSPEYQSGAITLGQAEGARKILLMNINGFDATNEAALRMVLHTIEHEFAHILHQTILFDKTFQDISTGFYNASGWKEYDSGRSNDFQPQSYSRGFLRNYGMLNKDEDFAEMLSMILVYGKKWFDQVVIPEAKKSTETDAAGALQKKLVMVEEYMQSSWGVRLLDNTITGEKGLESYVQAAVAKILVSPPAE